MHVGFLKHFVGYCYLVIFYRDEPLPCVAKSRLLQAKNANITLFNMDYVRHFIFVNDHIPFSKKENKVIF